MSKKLVLLSLVAVAVLSAAAVPFIGFDRYVGDHEVGSSWDPFIKSRPMLKMFFKNPEQYTLDFDPYETLDKNRQREFIEYCDIRWGTRDPHSCEQIVQSHRI